MPVTDERDIRTLIPRVRRAIDGPHAIDTASSNFTDDEIAFQTADAIAEIIFFSPDGFGKRLEVTKRDGDYKAPVEWQTSEPLTEEEASIVAIQAALNNFYFGISSMKTSERMQNEGQSWEWTISAQAVAERIRQLQKLRDEAIDRLDSSVAGIAAWVNTLEIRDAYTDRLIEPWVAGGTGGLELDPRFG